MVFFIFVCVVLAAVKIIEALLAKELICRECGFIGELVKKPKGSLVLEIVLWFCFLVPGVIYGVWRRTNRIFRCPSCGGQQVIPTDSPVGRQLILARNESQEQKLRAEFTVAVSSPPTASILVEEKKVQALPTQPEPRSFTQSVAFLLILILMIGFTALAITTNNDKSLSAVSKSHESGAKDAPQKRPISKPHESGAKDSLQKRPIEKTKSRSDGAMQTFRWAFNPALGCNEQTKTPVEITRERNSCKASVIPNPNAMLILVRCPIEANGAVAGNLDYIFVKSYEICLQVQDLVNGAEQ